MTPGPTNIPSEVFEAMSQNMHHRTDEFSGILQGLNNKLMSIFGSKNEVIILLCSGTGGLEASIVNLFSLGDKLLSVNCGVFGKRYTDIARLYGVDVNEIQVEWGYGIEEDRLFEELKKQNYKAVYVTYSETSTGVKNDIRQIGKIVKSYGCLFIVDVVSALGSLEFNAEEFNVDVAIAGSQKGFMCPPGLSLLSISDRAWEAIESSKMPRFYFDLRRYRNFNIPYTPGVSLILGLDRALDILMKEGMKRVLDRHRLYSRAVKNACSMMGLKEFPDKKFNSEVLTAVYVPDGIDEKQLRREMDSHGIVLAGGQGKLKGKIIRIGHMGYLTPEHIIRTVENLSISLNNLGYKNDTKKITDETNILLEV